MRVILKENVENLGRIGDVVRVSDGYARNFLLPKKWVVTADERNLVSLEHHKRVAEKKRQVREEEARSLVEKLAQVECRIGKKGGAQDKIFGSVTHAEVADQLKQAGYSIDKKWIHFEAPIKVLGIHPVQIRLEHSIVATIQVTVFQEE